MYRFALATGRLRRHTLLQRAGRPCLNLYHVINWWLPERGILRLRFLAGVRGSAGVVAPLPVHVSRLNDDDDDDADDHIHPSTTHTQ